MSMFVPIAIDMTSDIAGQPLGLTTNNDKHCEMCNKTCKKTRKLPECEHELCIQCLNKSLDKRSTWVDDKDNVITCPKCGVESSKLDLSLKTKPEKTPRRSKDAKGNTSPVDRKEAASGNTDLLGVDVRATPNAQRHNLSKFYTQTVEPVQTDATLSGSVFTRSSAMARLGGQRSAVRYSVRENYNGYPTYLSKDKHPCLYFDGDMLQGGHTLLSDWRNRVLKVYTKSGLYVCASDKLQEGPLNVTVMSNKVIVVTFGAKAQEMVFLSYDEEKLQVLGTSNIRNGWMYATTKVEDKCVGILEVEDKTPCLALIDVNESTIRSGSFRKSVRNWAIAAECPVSSESGLHYCHVNKCLYLTNRRTLYCYNADMKLIFKKTYDNAGKDLYILGSIACDCKHCIYVTSDQCILRVNSKTGSLQSTIPTDMDPYHILMGHDQTFLVLVGNQNNTLHCVLEQTGNDI